jgi:hypothetical protein
MLALNFRPTPMPTSRFAPVVDPLFKAAGFEVSGGAFQRRISGRYGGRECRIVLAPRTRGRYQGEVRRSIYAGHQMHMALTVAPRTRCGVFRREVLSRWSMAIKRWFGAKPVEPMPPSLHLLACWGFEPDWAAGWLGQPGVQEALARLFVESAEARAVTVSFDPVGRISLTVERLFPERIAPECFEHWLADLGLLAQAADAAPAPLRTLSPTRIELFVERHPLAAALAFFAAMGAVLVVLTVLIMAPLFLLFSWLIR